MALLVCLWPALRLDSFSYDGALLGSDGCGYFYRAYGCIVRRGSCWGLGLFKRHCRCRASLGRRRHAGERDQSISFYRVLLPNRQVLTSSFLTVGEIIVRTRRTRKRRGFQTLTRRKIEPYWLTKLFPYVGNLLKKLQDSGLHREIANTHLCYRLDLAIVVFREAPPVIVRNYGNN